MDELRLLPTASDVTRLFARAKLHSAREAAGVKGATSCWFEAVQIDSIVTQGKWTQIPSSPTSVSSVVHVSPADTGSARVSVPVVTISPAASGGLSGSRTRISTR